MVVGIEGEGSLPFSEVLALHCLCSHSLLSAAGTHPSRPAGHEGDVRDPLMGAVSERRLVGLEPKDGGQLVRRRVGRGTGRAQLAGPMMRSMKQDQLDE